MTLLNQLYYYIIYLIKYRLHVLSFDHHYIVVFDHIVHQYHHIIIVKMLVYSKRPLLKKEVFRNCGQVLCIRKHLQF